MKSTVTVLVFKRLKCKSPCVSNKSLSRENKYKKKKNDVGSVGADGHTSVGGVHRVIKEKKRQKHDKRRRKHETGDHVDVLSQMNLIGWLHVLFVLLKKKKKKKISLT